MLLAVTAQRARLQRQTAGLAIREALSGLFRGVGRHEGLTCAAPGRPAMVNPKGRKPPWTDTGKQMLLVCLLACVSQGLGPCPPEKPAQAQ